MEIEIIKKLKKTHNFDLILVLILDLILQTKQAYRGRIKAGGLKKL